VKVDFKNLSLAGGAFAQPSQYSTFLRETLKGTFQLKNFLGKNAVCTHPKTCKDAVYSPVPAGWKYSYHHWVETGPSGQIEAYSSPGMFGFYPWIDVSQQYYGVVAREAKGRGAYWESVLCGQAIRRAFLGKSGA
jgi:hypothetical protein